LATTGLIHGDFNADKGPVETRVRVIKEVVHKSLYVVDERAVADAIVLRAMAKLVIAEPCFRTEPRELQVRSFRPNRDARSFRLCSSPRMHRVGH
jgi:hypothetical protein